MSPILNCCTRQLSVFGVSSSWVAEEFSASYGHLLPEEVGVQG